MKPRFFHLKHSRTDKMASGKTANVMVYEDPMDVFQGSSPHLEQADTGNHSIKIRNGGRPASPPPEETLRPSKLRRHGSRILSALRSMTNSSKFSAFPWSFLSTRSTIEGPLHGDY